MYREGPRGSPFHTLLAEGYADGPIDVCKLKKEISFYHIYTLRIRHGTVQAETLYSAHVMNSMQLTSDKMHFFVQVYVYHGRRPFIKNGNV